MRVSTWIAASIAQRVIEIKTEHGADAKISVFHDLSRCAYCGSCFVFAVGDVSNDEEKYQQDGSKSMHYLYSACKQCSKGKPDAAAVWVIANITKTVNTPGSNVWSFLE